MPQVTRSASRFLLLVLLLGIQGVPTARAAEELKIWVSITGEQNVFKYVREPFLKATGIRIVDAGDAKVGNSFLYFKDVVEDKAEAATTALAFEDWVSLVKKQGYDHPDLKKITYRLIGRDLLLIFSNKKNGVAKLSMAQIDGVFSGRIKNWKELGGADLPIRVVTQVGKLATVQAFKKIAMADKGFSSATIEVNNHLDALAKVAQTPGAIGFAPNGTESDQVQWMDIPPLGRPLLLITKGRPSPKMQKLIEFIQAMPKTGK